MGKAQTATEYLIILAVVIIIALIVVGVMGGLGGGEPMNKELLATEMCEELGYNYGDYYGDRIGCIEPYGSGIANKTHYYKVDWDALNSLYTIEEEE